LAELDANLRKLDPMTRKVRFLPFCWGVEKSKVFKLFSSGAGIDITFYKTDESDYNRNYFIVILKGILKFPFHCVFFE